MAIYDQDIRKPFLNELTKYKQFVTDPTTVIIPEMNICAGSARIDIAVINHKLHGYEIKSERDTLDRLPSQMKFYNKFFDSVTLVISESHYSKAKTLVPGWWGIKCVASEDKLVFSNKRESQQNKNINSLSLARILWKKEQKELLEIHGINKGLKSKTSYELSQKIVNNISKSKIKDFVKNKLKSRETWRAVPIQQLCDDLPQ